MASEELYLKDSYFYVSTKKNNLIIAAFFQSIIFGSVNKDGTQFLTNQYFIFRHSQYHFFFLSFWNIIKTMSGNSQCNFDVIMKVSETEEYSWQLINNKTVKLVQKENQYFILLTLEELNEFIFILSQMMLPSLKLQTFQFDILNTITSLPLENILDLEDFAFTLKFITEKMTEFNIVKPQNYYIAVLIVVNLDIIITIHKLKLLSDEAKTPTKVNIDLLLNN